MAGKSLGEKVIERVVLTSAGKAANKLGDRVFDWLNGQLDDKKKKKKQIVRHDKNIDELDNNEEES